MAAPTRSDSIQGQYTKISIGDRLQTQEESTLKQNNRQRGLGCSIPYLVSCRWSSYRFSSATIIFLLCCFLSRHLPMTATTTPRGRRHRSHACSNRQAGGLSATLSLSLCSFLVLLSSTVVSAAEIPIYSSTAQSTTAGFSTALTPEETSKTCLAGKGTAVEPNVLRVAATKWHSGGLYCESLRVLHECVLFCM